MGEYFEEFKELAGNDVALYILKKVSEGKFMGTEAEDFCSHLHPEVRGNFIQLGPNHVSVILSRRRESLTFV